MSRNDVVATITMTLADGRTVVDIPIRREDVTTTNGAYRCVRDQAAEEIRDALHSMLSAHRIGMDVADGFFPPDACAQRAALALPNAEVLANGHCVGHTEYDPNHGTVLVMDWHVSGCEHVSAEAS